MSPEGLDARLFTVLNIRLGLLTDRHEPDGQYKPLTHNTNSLPAKNQWPVPVLQATKRCIDQKNACQEHRSDEVIRTQVPKRSGDPEAEPDKGTGSQIG